MSKSGASSSTTTTSTSIAPGVAPTGSATSEGQAAAKKHELLHTDSESSSSSNSDSDDDDAGDTTFGRFVAKINADLKKAKSSLKVVKMKQRAELGCSNSIATSNSKIGNSTPSDSEDEDEAETRRSAFENNRHLACYMTEVWDDPFCLRGFISDRSDSDSD